jgi:hypothetical protein
MLAASILTAPLSPRNGPSFGYNQAPMAIDWKTFGLGFVANAGLLLVLLKLFSKSLSDRIANLNAKHGKDLEQLRAKYAESLAGYEHELDKSKRRLQAEIDTTILVTRVHFETEFEALKEVFSQLAEVRLLMPGIRPFLGMTRPGETDEDKRNALLQRVTEFGLAYNKLISVAENLSPFYPQNIYQHIEDCRQAANAEILEVMTSADWLFTSGWYKQGQENLDRFLSAYSKASILIREHISKLAIAR